MKRPYIVHLISILTHNNLSLRVSIGLRDLKRSNIPLGNEITSQRMPIQAYKLLRSNHFALKVIGLNNKHQEIYKKVFETDSLGNLSIKIPLVDKIQEIKALQIFEVGLRPGLEIHLGNYIPQKISIPKKIIICDFDKTLVQTKYSTTTEMYKSLTSPLSHFPTINNSLELLQGHIKRGFTPFILSASPHFYEDAMRDWLYQHNIYTAGIFLKDYRRIFSFLDQDLTPKDLKVQGLYKLNHLLDILLMTGIPSELVLVGDNFESDPIIYLALSMLLKKDLSPWTLWNTIQKQKAFQLNKKQNAQFLNKIYQLSGLIKNPEQSEIDLHIFIRKRHSEDQLTVPEEFKKRIELVKLYDAPSNQLA